MPLGVVAKHKPDHPIFTKLHNLDASTADRTITIITGMGKIALDVARLCEEAGISLQRSSTNPNNTINARLHSLISLINIIDARCRQQISRRGYTARNSQNG
jgi:hypothetical protein